MARNLDRNNLRRRVNKEGNEWYNSSTELPALVRLAAPADSIIRASKIGLRKDGDDAVAAFLARGGKIRRTTALSPPSKKEGEG